MWTKFILLFCVALDGAFINGAKTKKNYDVIPEGFFGCGTPTEYTYADFHINTKLVNKTAFTIKGYYTVFRDITDNAKIQISADIWKQGQWTEGVFKQEFPTVCGGFDAVAPKLFSAMLNVSTDKKESCNFKAGNYTLDVPPIVIEFPNFSILPFGKFRFVGRVYDKVEKYFCFGGIGNVVPSK